MGGKDRKCHKCTFDGCDKIFTRPWRLQQHIRTHTGDRPYVCDYEKCGKSYTRSQHLARHIDISHTGIVSNSISYKCETCNQSFSSKHSLKRHQKRAHSEEKLYMCPEEDCNEGFKKRHQLRMHLFAHKGVLPFTCDYKGCSKQFKQSSHLEAHRKGHEGYRCSEDDCDLVFEKMSHYRKHKAKEHKKLYQCADCDKKFNRKSLLESHVRVHSGVSEKYKCPKENCDRSYFESRNLTAHIRSYHEGRKFTCETCGKDFASKQKQIQHSKQHDREYLSKKVIKPKPKGVKMAKRLSLYITGEKHEKSQGINSGSVSLKLRVKLQDESEKGDSCPKIDSQNNECELRSQTPAWETAGFDKFKNTMSPKDNLEKSSLLCTEGNEDMNIEANESNAHRGTCHYESDNSINTHSNNSVAGSSSSNESSSCLTDIAYLKGQHCRENDPARITAVKCHHGKDENINKDMSFSTSSNVNENQEIYTCESGNDLLLENSRRDCSSFSGS